MQYMIIECVANKRYGKIIGTYELRLYKKFGKVQKRGDNMLKLAWYKLLESKSKQHYMDIEYDASCVMQPDS